MARKPASSPSSILGITDLPCSAEDADALSTGKYVKGLSNFIRSCPTPMSIALQGDWGTGKTSIIHRLEHELKTTDSSIRQIYFNTWQYSQFNMKDSLYLSFVQNLVDALDPKSAASQLGKDIIASISALVTSAVKLSTGLDLNKSLKAFDHSEEQSQNTVKLVSELKDKFAQLVSETLDFPAKGAPLADPKRLVIFIDDLDRLNPEVAVELLEAIKLFMDVEHCVFVLAVDYDVVVSGVRKKYGGDFSDEKCRSFFDKIIQLPFRMPVEDYRLNGLLKETLGQYLIGDHIDKLTDMVTTTLGSNPRTFKRLANSFFLIYSVLQYSDDSDKAEDIKTQKTRYALILCSLCLQMAIPKFYSAMRQAEDSAELANLITQGSALYDPTLEDRQKYLRDYRIAGELSDTEWSVLPNALTQLSKILASFIAGDQQDQFTQFKAALEMASITGVSTASSAGTTNKEIAYITVGGNEISIPGHTAIDAFAAAFAAVLAQEDTVNPAKVDAYVESTELVSWDEIGTSSYFNEGKTYRDISLPRRHLYLGGYSGAGPKKDQINALCTFFSLPDGHVKWYNSDGDILYASKLVKLRSKASSH